MRCASASARQTHVGNDEGVRGKAAERRTFQCTLSVAAESRPQNPWVGLLARKVANTRTVRGPLHLPRPHGRVVDRSDTPSLTVAGPRRICTGFPVMPSWAPKARADTSTIRWRICRPNPELELVDSTHRSTKRGITRARSVGKSGIGHRCQQRHRLRDFAAAGKGRPDRRSWRS
jgi:hypothetical protein